MQKSKSIDSFAPTTEHTEYIPGTRSRPQHRSSLDTFIIPGRTRLPSSKSSQDSTDIQVAQALLNHNLLLQSKNPTTVDVMAARGAYGRKVLAQEHSSTPATYTNPSQPAPGRSDVNTEPPPPGYRGPEIFVVSPHRRSKTEAQATPQLFTSSTATNNEPCYDVAYDGVNDTKETGRVSRMTSMTWSTVSQRVFSDSSGSSRASRASEFKHEYNCQAEKYGLPTLTSESEDEESNSSQTQMTQKSHHHGWLARKFFRRSSSTYTLKAKTTYKPITRKKSFGGINLLSGDAPTNILSGQSLEEICRLGGLGILVLPPHFAADRLCLPTCLSATAAYLLQNGRNAPGLFRVSGTATTINELYRYFDHQFSDAGSPSKVEATVGAGHLPSEQEYTLPDIASLFKKIVIGLPGGLLGSLELFEALRAILLAWTPDPKLSAADPKRLRARLIALAILSVNSVYRVYLIQAVLGLVAYFGFEADKAQADERAATEGRPRQDQTGSELMGYQSLGKVLGPLLLGDLNASIETSMATDCVDGALNPRKSAEIHQENMKKHKKQKRTSIPNKIEKDANLTAHVDRANLAAEVMNLLLCNWREVVKQFRELNDLSSLLQPSKSMTQMTKIPNRIITRHSTNTSEDNLHLLDFLSGRSLPEEYGHVKGPVKMKRKVRITSRSPMARGAIKASEGIDEGHTWQPGTSEVRADESPSGSVIAESRAQGPASVINTGSFTQDSAVATKGRTKSDLAMDQMAMGTILTPPKDTVVSPEHKFSLRHVSPAGTPLRPSRTRSSSDAPNTAFRVPPQPMQRTASAGLVNQYSTDKPLPPIGDAQRAESMAGSAAEYTPPVALDEEQSKRLHERIMSSRRSRRSRASVDNSPFATRQATPRTLFPSRSSGHWTPPEIPSIPEPLADTAYPPRQSSLPSENGYTARPIDPLPTFESMAEYKKWCELHPSSPALPPASRKISNCQPAADEVKDRAERNSSGSVKFLAQKFTEASRVARNEEQARNAAEDSDIPKVYAYVRPLPRSLSSLYDPFLSSSDMSLNRNPSPERETLIPKPIHEVGRVRNAESPRSPTKTSTSPKWTAPASPKGKAGRGLSNINFVRDKDAEIVRSNVKGDGSIYSDAHSTVENALEPVRLVGATTIGSCHQSKSRESDVSPTRPFSYESVRRPQIGSERPEIWHHPRVLPVDRPLSTSQSDDHDPVAGYLSESSPSRINAYWNASDALKKQGHRKSVNATLYEEVMRLQRLVEHRGEEVQAARRSLDAVRESRDARDVNPSRFSARNSWSKGTIIEDTKDANREVHYWKRRAEEAERLLALVGQPDNLTEQNGVSVDVVLEGDGRTEGQGVDVEVLVDREVQEQERVTELYEDKGWAGDTLALHEEVDVKRDGM